VGWSLTVLIGVAQPVVVLGGVVAEQALLHVLLPVVKSPLVALACCF
jgi:hypothetical protein